MNLKTYLEKFRDVIRNWPIRRSSAARWVDRIKYCHCQSQIMLEFDTSIRND